MDIEDPLDLTMTSDSHSSVLVGAERWLGSRRRAVLVCLLGLALLVRVVVYAEVQDSPVVHTHRRPSMDMAFFHQWAVDISVGDVLGRTPRHPIHMWHEQVAEKFFERTPEAFGLYSDGTDAERRGYVASLWNGWYGGNAFHQEPLYPYLIAAVFKLTGSRDLRAVFWLQMLGGVLTVGLLFGVTRRIFGDLTAVLAGLMAGLWGPLIHFENSLLRASLVTLAGVALLYATQRAAERMRGSGLQANWRQFAFGILIGVATTLKSTFLPISLGFIAGLYWPYRHQLRAAVPSLLTLGGGVLLALAPIIARNLTVGAPWLGMTSVGPVTFAGSNIPQTVPAYGWYPFHTATEALARVMFESQGSFSKSVSSSLALFGESPQGYMAYPSLLWQKFAMIWHWFELPNNVNYYATLRYSNVLELLSCLVSAWWIMSLGVIGLVFAGRARLQIGHWVWFIICSLGTMIVFYVLSRFRAPMVVTLMPFAAYGLTQIVEMFGRRRTKAAVWLCVLSVCLCASMLRPIPNPGRPTEPRALVGSDWYAFSFMAFYRPEIEGARARGDLESAVQRLEELLDECPASLEGLDLNHLPETLDDYFIAMAFVDIYPLAAELYLESGNHVRWQQCTVLAEQFEASTTRYKAIEEIKEPR